MNIVLTGGTGFIGRCLLQHLIEGGHKVTLLTRHPHQVEWLNKHFVTPVHWDGKHVGAWAEKIDGADAVINLAGEPLVKKRWSNEVKKHIIESRVKATELIVSAIEKASKKPSVLVNASAVGYYGNVPEGEVDEQSPRGSGFLAHTCEEWEKAAGKVEASGVRLVILRIGIVLGEGGGVLSKIVPSFQMFMGGAVGSGRQWFPWVHREDVAGAILFALAHPEISGRFNVTAPEAVNMKEFSATLGKFLGRPSWFHVPGFVMKAALGEMSEMLLLGQKAIPRRLERAGYSFSYPQLESALKSILK